MSRIGRRWRNLRLNHGHALAVGGGVILAALFGLLLWGFLDWYIKPDEATAPSSPSTAKKDLMQAWGFIMAGVAGGIGIYFTWRNLRSTQDNLQLIEQGQITERFTEAINQLGATDDDKAPRLEIRLGGIYTLARIAKDSPERAYSIVIGVLTAYVRENSRRVLTEGTKPNAMPKPTADIQAILDVLLKRLKWLEGNGTVPEDDRLPMILQEAYLDRANLYMANLRGAYLDGAFLRSAYLHEAHLNEAFLRGANLQGANLQRANLRGANLWRADLREAVRWEADLRNTRYLTQEQINEAYGDENTKLPDHLQRPVHWSKGDEEESEEDEGGDKR